MDGDTCSLFEDIRVSDQLGWEGVETVSETGCALFDDVHGLTGLMPGPTECPEEPAPDDQVGDDTELPCVPAAVVPVAANRCRRSYRGDQMALFIVPPFRKLRPKSRPSALWPVPTAEAVNLPEVRSTSPPVTQRTVSPEFSWSSAAVAAGSPAKSRSAASSPQIGMLRVCPCSLNVSPSTTRMTGASIVA